MRVLAASVSSLMSHFTDSSPPPAPVLEMVTMSPVTDESNWNGPVTAQYLEQEDGSLKVNVAEVLTVEGPEIDGMTGFLLKYIR